MSSPERRKRKPVVPKGFVMRLFCESDIDRIHDLFSVSFPVAYTDEYYECFRKQFFCGAKLITYVAEIMNGDDPEIIGCIIMQERSTDGSDKAGPVVIERYLYSTVLYILNIAVFPDYRKQGIGSLLIQKCEECCENNELCAGIYLHVLTTNDKAVKFYEQHGFSQIQRFTAFYVINDEWADSFLYFLSPKGVHVSYNASMNDSHISTPLVILVSLSLIGYVFYIIYTRYK